MKDMTLTELHHQFLGAIRAERAIAESTLCSYASDFRLFLGWLKQQRKRDELRYFTAENVRDWQINLSERDRSPATINRRIAALSSFGRWLVRWHKLPANPVEHVRRSPRKRTLPKYLTLPEYKHLLALELPTAEALMRDILCYTAIRREELITLDWSRVDTTHGFITVQRKGGHEQSIPLPQSLQDALRDYGLSIGPEHTNGPVFVGPYGRMIHRHRVNRLVANWGKRIGRFDLHPHLIRHTFATHFKGDLRHLQELLRHARIDTTQRYRHVIPGELADAVRGFQSGL